jgi:hypothetical protein
MLFLALLVVVRFVLEISGTPATVTRYLSSMVGLVLTAIYLAAVAPLKRGMLKFSQLILPALLLSAWTVGWVILATLVSGVFHLERSHFAGRADYGNWRHLGFHIFEHVVEIGILFVVVLVLMALVHLLWRWPVTVGPGAMLGALVVVRYWLEAMGLPVFRTAAWSSTVGILVAAFYLGGVGPRLGLAGGRQLFLPALVLGWTWRVWVLVAILMSAFPPYIGLTFSIAPQATSRSYWRELWPGPLWKASLRGLSSGELQSGLQVLRAQLQNRTTVARSVLSPNRCLQELLRRMDFPPSSVLTCP